MNLRIWLIVFALHPLALIQPSDSRAQSPRAATPDWSQQDVSEIFFDDAFAEGLDGQRPDDLGRPLGARQVGSRTDAQRHPDTVDATFGWSSLITAATIEDTIKSLRFDIDRSVTQPAPFAAGGANDARRQFTILACLFTIVHEYDGNVRWKREAIAARDLCQATAQAMDKPDRAAFQIAKEAKEQIADLIRGGRLVANDEHPPLGWDQIADRRILMQQLDTSMKAILRPASSSPAALREQASAFAREAELTAALAEILTREEMDDASNDDYVGYCRQIQSATRAVLAAIEAEDATAAGRAVGTIHKACGACHADYRG